MKYVRSFAIKPINGQKSQLESIVILGEIHAIKSKAFYNLEKLTQISISMSHLKNIEDRAFKFDHQLKKLILFNINNSSLKSCPTLNQTFHDFEKIHFFITSHYDMQYIPE